MLAFSYIVAILPFITPAIFGMGVAATSVPIIIHLLSKRRFRVVVWAAMDFLLAAQRRNARRLQFQRWLMLLLRIAALLILAAAIAQFVWNSALASTVLGAQQRATVIVLDDSYSMGYAGEAAAGVGTHFDRAKKLLLAWLDTQPASEQLALLSGSSGSESPIPRLTLDNRAVRRAVEAAVVSDGATDLATAIGKATDILADAKGSGSRSIIVITDGSASSVGDGVMAERVRKTIAGTKGIADVRVVDVGEEGQGNIGISGFAPRKPVLVAGQAVEWVVEVFNGSNKSQGSVGVQLLIDGVVQQTGRTGKLDPGARGNAVISQAFTTPGSHMVEAKLTISDGLEIDNTRRAMVDVKTEVPVLLVDGNSGDRDNAASTLYVQAALSQSVSQVFAPKVITELELPNTPLNTFGIVVLSDTAAPGEGVARNLRRFVDDGGLLLVFPGDRTVPGEFNRVIGSGGAKILPADFGGPVKLEGTEQLAKGLTFDPLGYAHPVLAKFADAVRTNSNTGLTSVQTTEYLKLLVPAEGGVETILKYTSDAKTAGSDPAVVLKREGRGTVVQFASTADKSWSNFAPKPAFLEFMDGLVYYALPHDDGGQTLLVGEGLNLRSNVASPGVWNGPHNVNLDVAAALDKADEREHLRSGPIRWAGLYQPTGTSKPVIVVNTDPSEIDIRHMNAAQLSQATGLDAGVIVNNPPTLEATVANVNSSVDASTNIGLNLIPVALLLLLLETFFARMFSMYR